MSLGSFGWIVAVDERRGRPLCSGEAAGSDHVCGHRHCSACGSHGIYLDKVWSVKCGCRARGVRSWNGRVEFVAVPPMVGSDVSVPRDAEVE